MKSASLETGVLHSGYALVVVHATAALAFSQLTINQSADF